MGAGQSKQRQRRVAVLGAGPSGLATAYTLLKQHPTVHVDVFEAAPAAGGAVMSRRGGGFLYDLGPNSMNAKHARVHELLFSSDQLALGPRVADRQSSRRFLILKDGVPTVLPTSPGALLRTPLLSLRAKLRLLAEPLIPRGKGSDSGSGSEFESVGSFVQRRFGREVLQYVVDPAIAGIYSARPEHLSMRHAFGSVWAMERDKGSVVGGFLLGKKKKNQENDAQKKDRDGESPKEAVSRGELMKGINYDGGMAVLTDTLEQRIRDTGRVRFMYNTAVHSVDQDKKHIKAQNKRAASTALVPYSASAARASAARYRGNWRVNGRRTRYDAVVSTIPTHSLPTIESNVRALRKGFKRLSSLIPYSPVSVLVLGFDRAAVPTSVQGYGLLVPAVEKKAVLGVNFTSDGFPARLDSPDRVFWTVYLGGGRNPAIVHRLSDNQKVTLATKEVQGMLGVKAKPLFTDIKNWSRGIPLYGRRYEEALCAIARIEKRAAGSFIMAGNYKGGVGVPDALLSGIESGSKIGAYLDTL